MKRLSVIIFSALVCGVVLKSCGSENTELQEDVSVKNSECDMLEFTDEANSVSWEINGTNITAVYPSGTDLSSITPLIIVSEKASVNPASGTKTDFSNEKEVTFTVTAEDGTEKVYKVQAKTEKNSECDILEFTDEANSVSWEINGTDITAVYPSGTDLSSITPLIIVSERASINPPSGIITDFSNEKEVIYTLTAEDGTEKIFKAQAIVLKSSKCDIIWFRDSKSFKSWKINDTRITAVYPSVTDLSSITPLINVSDKASVNPQSGATADFSNEKEVIYTVTAEDGTEKLYYAQVISYKCSECDDSKLDDDLILEMMKHERSYKLDINIILKKQFDQYKNESEWPIFKDNEERRTFVINELKKFSQETQKDLLMFLSDMEAISAVSDIRSLWLGNSISCYASIEVIEALSLHSDVLIIGWNKVQIMGDNKPTNVEQTRDIAYCITKVPENEVWAAWIPSGKRQLLLKKQMRIVSLI